MVVTNSKLYINYRNSRKTVKSISWTKLEGMGYIFMMLSLYGLHERLITCLILDMFQ